MAALTRTLPGWGLIGMMLLSGCVTRMDQPTPVAPIEHHQAMRMAHRLQSGHEGRVMGLGSGSSMAPIFGEGSVLVLHPIAYDELEKDMFVAYRGQDGRQIVHRLAVKRQGYWYAWGLNNTVMDQEPVTPQNLIGVVYGILPTPAGRGR